MMARMMRLSTTSAAGSLGVVETQVLDLARPVQLDCGEELYPVRVAYEAYGTLSPSRDNVILVCHALSGDAHAAGIAKTGNGSLRCRQRSGSSPAVVPVAAVRSQSPPGGEPCPASWADTSLKAYGFAAGGHSRR